MPSEVHVIPVWNGMDPLDAFHEQQTLGHVHGYRWWWPVARFLRLKRCEWAAIEVGDDDATSRADS
jgi:hypothetical protein